jgi:hypothetical protein
VSQLPAGPFQVSQRSAKAGLVVLYGLPRNRNLFVSRGSAHKHKFGPKEVLI